MPFFLVFDIILLIEDILDFFFLFLLVLLWCMFYIILIILVFFIVNLSGNLCCRNLITVNYRRILTILIIWMIIIVFCVLAREMVRIELIVFRIFGAAVQRIILIISFIVIVELLGFRLHR